MKKFAISRRGQGEDMGHHLKTDSVFLSQEAGKVAGHSPSIFVANIMDESPGSRQNTKLGPLLVSYDTAVILI